MVDISKIPLNDIVQDPRVEEYVRKQRIQYAKKYVARHSNSESQALSCHFWLLCLHYTAITRLQGKYDVSKPEFMVLTAAYLFKRKGMNGFRVKDLNSIVLSWQYNTTYRHLRKLTEKGYFRMEKNPYNGVQRYYMTSEGVSVIRAFHQHYRMVFAEVWEKIGDLPNSVESFLPGR